MEYQLSFYRVDYTGIKIVKKDVALFWWHWIQEGIKLQEKLLFFYVYPIVIAIDTDLVET